MRHALPALMLGLALAVSVHAVEKTDQARLRLPWETLKGVLRIEQDQVRLSSQEFQTLLKLTSPTSIPPYNLSGGDVLLPRAEFTRLVQSLVPPANESANAYIPKASYRGRVSKDSALFSASLLIEVPHKPAKSLSLDVFPGQAAFQEISLDGRSALAEVRNGRLFVTVSEAGTHRLDLRFSLPVPDVNAAQALTIPIARTPITEWILDIPEPNLDIAVPAALHRELSAVAQGTRVRALLPPSDSVSASWNPLAPDRAKGPAQVYATVDHLITIEDDALRVNSRVELEVLQNTINEMTLELPKGFAVLDVRGEAVKEWQEIGTPAQLTVPLKSARKGQMTFHVMLERVLPGEKSTTTFTGLTVIGAQRQRGHIGVELKSDVELPLPHVEGLDPKDPFRELPPALTAQSERLVFGYHYVRPPFTIGFTLSRHESVDVPLSFVDRAEGSTVIRPDGKRVHRLTYWVKSSAQQFLGITLPEKTALWSAFVDNTPVKPVAGPNSKTLIPLVRSARALEAIFPVEIVLFEEKRRLPLLGPERLRIPMPDLMVNRLQWTVIAPADHQFRYFGRDFEDLSRPTEFAHRESLGVAKGLSTVIGNDKGQPFQDQLMMGKKEKQNLPSSRRMDTSGFMDLNELAEAKESSIEEDSDVPPPAMEPGAPVVTAVGGAVALPAPSGMLPVRVAVPDQGTRTTYSKTLPGSEGVLILPLWQWARWTETAAKVALGILAIFLLVLFRRPLLAQGHRALFTFRAFHGRTGYLWTPPRAAVLAFTVALLASGLSGLLFALAVLLYAVAVGRWFLSLFDSKEGERP